MICDLCFTESRKGNNLIELDDLIQQSYKSGCISYVELYSLYQTIKQRHVYVYIYIVKYVIETIMLFN